MKTWGFGHVLFLSAGLGAAKEGVKCKPSCYVDLIVRWSLSWGLYLLLVYGQWTGVKSDCSILGDAWSIRIHHLFWSITADKTKKCLFEPESKVFLVVLSDFTSWLTGAVVRYMGEAVRLKELCFPWLVLLFWHQLAANWSWQWLYNDGCGVFTLAVCMWASKRWSIPSSYRPCWVFFPLKSKVQLGWSGSRHTAHLADWFSSSRWDVVKSQDTVAWYHIWVV